MHVEYMLDELLQTAYNRLGSPIHIHAFLHTRLHTGGVNVDELLQSLIDLPTIGSTPEARRDTSDLTVVPASHALAVSMALRQEHGGDEARYVCVFMCELFRPVTVFGAEA
jgi:hypothetical protein